MNEHLADKLEERPCRICGRIVIFRRAPDGSVVVLDRDAPTWLEIDDPETGRPFHPARWIAGPGAHRVGRPCVDLRSCAARKTGEVICWREATL